MFGREIGYLLTDALKLGRQGIPRQRKSPMLRSARLVMMVLIAMFVVTVPTALGQTPATDQYLAPVADGTGAVADKTGAAGSPARPVQVRELTAKQAGDLPFTGGQVSLIALIGLGLVAVGAAGLASNRRRTAAITP